MYTACCNPQKDLPGALLEVFSLLAQAPFPPWSCACILTKPHFLARPSRAMSMMSDCIESQHMQPISDGILVPNQSRVTSSGRPVLEDQIKLERAHRLADGVLSSLGGCNLSVPVYLLPPPVVEC
jgi:hypothetical protein